MQKQLKAIVSPFRGLRIEEFMKIHGSMPDQVQIRSFMTVGGPSPDQASSGSIAGTARAKGASGLSDMTMTPQPNRYASVNKQANATTAKGFDQ